MKTKKPEREFLGTAIKMKVSALLNSKELIDASFLKSKKEFEKSVLTCYKTEHHKILATYCFNKIMKGRGHDISG